MALELLAGPVPVQRYGEQPCESYSHAAPFWLDDVGLVTSAMTATRSGWLYSVIQLDGSLWERSTFEPGVTALKLGWDFQTQRVMGLDGSARLAFFDPLTGRLGPRVLATSLLAWQWARWYDRFLEALSGKMYYLPLTTTTAIGTAEYTFSQGGGAGRGVISDAGDGTVYVGFTDGKLYRYNPTTRQEVGSWKTLGLANKGIWYSRRFGVLISLHANGDNTDSLRVWSPEVRPDQLSAPVPAYTLRAGRVTRFQATVQGAQGEPCPEHPVGWRLEGPGQLLAAQSNTDAAGVATVDYQCPLGATGAATVTAEVKY